MVQLARPIEDTIIGGYTDAADGVTDIFESIDETVASDVDFVQSRNPPINDGYVVKLTPLEAAAVFTDHIVRTRVRSEIGSEWGVDYFLELREEFVDGNNQGMLIKQWFHALIPNTFTTYEDTMTEEEANDIQDYTLLYLYFKFNVAQEPIA